MTDDALPKLDRITELLADRALFGIDEEEQRELDALLAATEDFDVELLDRAAASAQLATLGQTEALPEEFSIKLASQGQEALAAKADTKNQVRLSPPPMTFRRRELIGWIAAAASVTIAAFALTDRPPTAAQLRGELLALANTNANQFTQVAWTVPEGAAVEAESGDVVWHNGRQEGVMRFTGLPANDPTIEQYQLWIFDSEQDERYPIDGGVFDVPPGSNEAFVKIDAKLPVSKPTLFAITIEKPGGVVVSSRERLPLLAQVENN